MQLKGSCHCQAVRFTVESTTPQPYMRCYCSICRKTAGGGGYAINVMGRYESLSVEGREAVSVYRVAQADGSESDHRRHFCGKCGSALWVWSPSWPDLVHPFASALDAGLPAAAETVHIMLDSKADWVPVDGAEGDARFREYPDRSIADWHAGLGLEVE